MKKNGHKLFTLVALLGTAAGVIHIANRFIDATSQLKDMLEQPHSKTYDWRFGKIHYTKQGHGAPLLLVHDMMAGASGYEWTSVEKQLATEHTVYTLDLLGCGRSEKPDITYTNFVYAQLLCDFAKNAIHNFRFSFIFEFFNAKQRNKHTLTYNFNIDIFMKFVKL